MELKHFADEHPLVFMKDPRCFGVLCDRCDKEVLGSCYSCEKCDFDLHKSCAEDELPLELHHPIHPKHPLILFKKPPYDEKAFTCNGCNERWRRFVYHCALCKFDLDIKCALLPLTKEAEVHEHPLTLLRKSMLFTCDVCGQEGKGWLYLCAICPFVVDIKCVFLPHSVNLIRHEHPLKLTYSLQVDKLDNLKCLLCVKKIAIDYGVYFCSNCNFVAHLSCAADKESIDDVNKSDLQDTVFNELTVGLDLKDAEFNESIDSSYVVKKVDVGEDGNEMATEIEHFSHEHDLVLTNELENNEKCYACIQPIFPPAFGCVECGFYFHKLCVELPRKKRHPLHKHPLTLSNLNLVSWCEACGSYCNGFVYKCDECRWFKLDVRCSEISDNLTHEGHEHHPLILSNENGNCSACGENKGYLFRCAICDFTLNFSCVTLPHTVRYKSHEHPFILTYHTVDDGSDEYYCDICENLRDPNHCYYYCKQCDYPAHPKCILGENPHINIGRTYKFSFHQHPFTLARRTKDQYLCDICGLTMYNYFYECTLCNDHICHNCFRKLVNER